MSCLCTIEGDYRIFNGCIIHQFKLGEMKITKALESKVQEWLQK